MEVYSNICGLNNFLEKLNFQGNFAGFFIRILVEFSLRQDHLVGPIKTSRRVLLTWYQSLGFHFFLGLHIAIHLINLLLIYFLVTFQCS